MIFKRHQKALLALILLVPAVEYAATVVLVKKPAAGCSEPSYAVSTGFDTATTDDCTHNGWTQYTGTPTCLSGTYPGLEATPSTYAVHMASSGGLVEEKYGGSHDGTTKVRIAAGLIKFTTLPSQARNFVCITAGPGNYNVCMSIGTGGLVSINQGSIGTTTSTGVTVSTGTVYAFKLKADMQANPWNLSGWIIAASGASDWPTVTTATYASAAAGAYEIEMLANSSDVYDFDRIRSTTGTTTASDIPLCAVYP